MNLSKFDFLKKDWKDIVIFILAILAILGLRYSIMFKSHYEAQKSLYRGSRDTTIYREKDLKTGDTIVSKEAIALDKQVFNSVLKENSRLKDKVRNFKSVSSLSEEVTQTNLGEIHIEYPDTSQFSINIVLDSAKYFLDFTVGKKSFSLNRLSIKDTSTTIVGFKNRGLFRKPEFDIQISHSNPLVHTVNLNNYTIQNNTKWYNSGVFHFVEGAVIAGTFVYLIKH